VEADVAVTTLVESSPPGAVAPAACLGLEGRLEALERERRDLWSWVFHLERLAQSGLMAGGLAHDTRNLLAAVSGHCQLALRDDAADDVKQNLRTAIDLANKAAKAVAVFLTFARGHARQAEVCVLADVVGDALRFLDPVLRVSAVRVGLSFEPGLRARCEPTLLLQALVNLVLNAVRAIGDRPGRIDVVGRAGPGGNVTIDVADDGPGVPAAVRARLFQPFATAASARATRAPAPTGTGLGLFVTRRVLEEQGGTIALLEDAPLGATFRIQLPGPDAPAGEPAPHRDTDGSAPHA
jgi:signal transduction histidine kinase